MEITWNKLHHFPPLKYESYIGNRAPLCQSCTHVPSCFKLKPLKFCGAICLHFETLIIGNTNLCSVRHLAYLEVWMWTDSSNPPRYRFTFYITWEIHGSDVWLLFSLSTAWRAITRNGCCLYCSRLRWRPACCLRSGGWDSTTGREHGRARAQPPKDER